jgi:murein DD-endopeptidase MepM/ murein hydrolase activator NlpD
MKAFLIFLAGALLGSAALWFFVVGRYDGVDEAKHPAPTTAPASLPVTQPPLKLGPPKARPAIRLDPAAAPAPPTMTPVSQPEVPGATSSADAASPAPVLPAHAAILPPESTPVAPVAAGGSVLLAPPMAVPTAPMRALELAMPVAGVKPTQLLDTFKDARGEGRVHDAIDIMAPTGTPVYAVEDGTIEKLFDSKQGGHTIYQFDVDREIAYYYAHLDRYADGLVQGQAVKRGDLIGYVGYSGNANPAGPHLHFAIFLLGPEKKWWKGTAINPYAYLGGR